MSARGSSRGTNPIEPEGGDPHSTSLDLLEVVDKQVLSTFGSIRDNSGQGVEPRARRGDLVKRLIREIATRESAVIDICGAISSFEPLGHLAAQMTGTTAVRRRHIDRVEKMSRGIRGLYLNQGQDFRGALEELEDTMTKEILWDLDTGIPGIRSLVSAQDQSKMFSSGDHVVRHAPTNLHPERPRWREHARVVSRALTIVDHLRDFPSAADQDT
ncbi:MAG: hypothetical protein ACRDVP_12715 [Acidimicrobiales bacterium]